MELTETLRRRIVDEILAGKYSLGDRLPTEREMADLSGMSRITVRRAYAQLEKAGIITRRPSAGTCVSSAFRASSDGMEQIAVIATLRDPFAVDFIDAVNKACRENDALNVLALAGMGASEQSEIAAGLAAKGVRDLIVWGYDRRSDFSVFERLRVLGVNMVFFDRLRPGPFADFVGLDNRDAIETLFKKALADGMKRLLYVEISGLSIDSNDERRETALRLCRKREIPCEIEQIPYLAKPSQLAPLAERLKSFKGAAVLCVNDNVALSVAPFLPPSARLYAVDGSPEAVQAGVVSYSQPIREMAAASVECLKRQQRLGEKWTAGLYLFKGRLLSK